MRVLAVIAFVVCLAPSRAKEYTELERSRLPRLFHLDDYDRCVGLGGLYCTGTFRLHAERPSATYNFIKEYASDPRHFDRTLLHRGYCLTARCPDRDPNITRRFERCVERHALMPGIAASSVSYSCSPTDEPVDTPQKVFLVGLLLVILLNVVGTTYDVLVDGAKNRLLLAWSVRSNWRWLTSPPTGDKRRAALAPLHSVRVILLILVMMVHSAEIQHMLFQYNPHFLEWALEQPLTMLIRNGSGLTQGFLVMSNFLFAYNLILMAEKRKVGLRQLPLCVMHRFVRLAPVHMAVVGFAATWWRRAGAGPQWAGTVGAEAAVCRRKFWAHLFFLHNVYDTDHHCLLQTWFIAVDMQLFVVSAALTLWLLESKKRAAKAIPILSALFVGACLLNFALAYINDWKSLIFIMVPELVRVSFAGVSSFGGLYAAAWGALPAALLGLLLAHVRRRRPAATRHTVLVWLYHLIIPAHVACIMSGLALGGRGVRGGRGRGGGGRLARAVFAAIERPAFAMLAAVYVLGIVNNVQSWLRRVLSLRPLQVLGRLSLAALMLHWCVNMQLVASGRTLVEVSVGNIASTLISTVFWTYVLALPLTLLLEAPARNTFSALIA